MPTIRHITLPGGFVAAGVKAHVKDWHVDKEDVALIVGTDLVAAALLTTRNQFVGEPVKWCRQALPKGFGRIRGIVMNSGCANVATGTRGARDARAMATRAATDVGAKPAEMLVASTGVIGRFLPIEKILSGIDLAAGQLGVQNDQRVLRAIMTTDTREKTAVAQFSVGGKTVTVAGICKGAGMIAPSLATMISVVTTDAAIAAPLLYKHFKHSAQCGYNAVTIDSDTSTSDTAVAMASGASGVAITAGSAAQKKFAAALDEVCRELAIAIARDGEGATKLIQVTVRGARNDAQAEAAAKSVANSPLFKCAVNGGDPNWGRVASALGKSPAKVVPEKLSIRIGGIKVFARGLPANADLAKVQAHMKTDTVLVDADLGLGKGRFVAYTCDLSKEYVAINADYTT